MTDVRFAVAISLDREHESPITLNRARPRESFDLCTMPNGGFSPPTQVMACHGRASESGNKRR
jgi:hypothetical protein